MELSYAAIKKYTNDNMKVISIILFPVIYIIGYLKYFALLQRLDIKMPVNDVFPILSIFISGITMLISLLYIPFFVLCLLSEEKKEKIPGRMNWPVKYILLIVCAIIPLFIRGFILTPFSSLSVLAFLSLIIAIIYVLHRLKKLKWRSLLLIFICWWISIGASYYLSLPSSKDSYFNLNIDSTVNQDSGISGYIITRNIISPNSTRTDFYSNSDELYRTFGILLSSHDGNYYFYTNNRLYLIPYGSVILFDQFIHSATR